jgi:hypothetical protein
LIQRATNFNFGVHNGIFHAALDIPMTVLLRIEFWRISWQVLYMNMWMLLQKRFHDFGFMGTRSIPDQDERAFDVTHQVFQSDQQFFGIDRAIKMSFVDLARNRQANYRRCFPAKLGNPFQLWRLAFRRPSEADRFCIGEPKFIFKYDLCAEPSRLFLSSANPGSTRPGSSLHPVQSPLCLVFAHSNPDHPTNG